MKLILTGLGLVFELAGLAIVVLDARQTRRDATSVVRRDVTVRLGSLWSTAKSGIVGTISGGSTPTLEQRVAALESSTSSRIDALEAEVADTRRLAAERTMRTQHEALSHADELDRDLRVFMSQTLGGGRAVMGVILFAIGATLAAAANLV